MDSETKQEQTQREERGAQFEAPEPVKHWVDGYEPRMQKHIQFALDYAANYNHGAPGHLDLLTIAMLARHLSFALDMEPPYAPEPLDPGVEPPTRTKTIIQKVAWSESDQCWRDLVTGVRVQL